MRGAIGEGMPAIYLSDSRLDNEQVVESDEAFEFLGVPPGSADATFVGADALKVLLNFSAGVPRSWALHKDYV